MTYTQQHFARAIGLSFFRIVTDSVQPLLFVHVFGLSVDTL